MAVHLTPGSGSLTSAEVILAVAGKSLGVGCGELSSYLGEFSGVGARSASSAVASGISQSRRAVTDCRMLPFAMAWWASVNPRRSPAASYSTTSFLTLPRRYLKTTGYAHHPLFRVERTYIGGLLVRYSWAEERRTHCCTAAGEIMPDEVT